MQFNVIVKSISDSRSLVRNFQLQQIRKIVVIKPTASAFCGVPEQAKGALENHGGKGGLKHPKRDETPAQIM